MTWCYCGHAADDHNEWGTCMAAFCPCQRFVEQGTAALQAETAST